MRRSVKIAMLVAGGLVVVAAAVTIGRVSAPTGSHAHGIGDYFDGLRAGEAQGRMEGRASQEGMALPAHDRAVARDAFTAGYVAGMNDAFAGYDGGWSLHAPWIVTLEPGTGQVVYRIQDRTRIEPGVDYYLCPNGHDLCSHPR